MAAPASCFNKLCSRCCLSVRIDSWHCVCAMLACAHSQPAGESLTRPAALEYYWSNIYIEYRDTTNAEIFTGRPLTDVRVVCAAGKGRVCFRQPERKYASCAGMTQGWHIGSTLYRHAVHSTATLYRRSRHGRLSACHLEIFWAFRSNLEIVYEGAGGKSPRSEVWTWGRRRRRRRRGRVWMTCARGRGAA